MITKTFGNDFSSFGGALTLDYSLVDEDPTEWKQHSSGWKIKGEIREDYYAWVNEFEAIHESNGWVVSGDFERSVTATNEEAFQHFWENHEPNDWDYSDI